MNTKHKHHEFMVAWAEGKPIQYWNIDTNDWCDIHRPSWALFAAYRIKPEEKKKTKMWQALVLDKFGIYFSSIDFFESKQQAQQRYGPSFIIVDLLAHTKIEVDE